MMVRLFTIGLFLILSGLFSATAVAQTSSALLYGSLAPAESSSVLSSNSAYYSPTYVAQNTTPAAITFVPSTPATIPASTVPTTPTTVLPSFDPYRVSSQSSWPLSPTPVSTGTSELGQSSYSNVYSGNFDRFVPETYEAVRRFRDATSFEYTHRPRSGSKDRAFGMDEIDLRMQLAFPCRFIPNNGRTGFFYVAPGTSFVWWNGPTSPDISPNGFGTFLDLGLQPKFNDIFSLIAWGRVGLFSDYHRVTSEAVRFQGRLEGVGMISPQMELHAGVIYYGRARIKLLPTAGIVWNPDANWTLRLMFPNPKISRRLWTGQQADWWGYMLMDYAGGSWDIKPYGLTDYNDIRLGAGIEFFTPSRVAGYFEFGGCFDREIYFNGRQQATLPAVLYFKTGFMF